MRENVEPLSVEKDHWSKGQRSVTKEITYGSCTGKPFDVKSDIQWPRNEKTPCKIIIRKTFKVNMFINMFTL